MQFLAGSVSFIKQCIEEKTLRIQTTFIQDIILENIQEDI